MSGRCLPFAVLYRKRCFRPYRSFGNGRICNTPSRLQGSRRWPYLAANSLRFPLSCSEPTYRLQPLPYWGCLRSSVQSGCSVIRTAGNVRRLLTWSFQSKVALSSRCNSGLRGRTRWLIPLGWLSNCGGPSTGRQGRLSL